MKVLVTGVKGQLGFDVVNELKKRGHEAVGVDIGEMDITDRAAVARVLGEVKPDAVIHCAAWTAVDAAEDNAEKVRLVNAAGTENIALECKKLGCKMMYISTDYVFDVQHFARGQNHVVMARRSEGSYSPQIDEVAREVLYKLLRRVYSHFVEVPFALFRNEP